jgi:hypothetical protein
MSLEVLGGVSFPSGRAVIVDTGLLASGLDPDFVVRVDDVPRDRVYDVVGERVGTGDWAECWRWVGVEFRPGVAVSSSEEVGTAPVDCARLMFVDATALEHWRDDESLDGKADFVFWGRDAEALAQTVGAPPTDEGFGWTNLPLGEAIRRGMEAERVKQERDWKLATDFRPHTHHYVVLAQARANTTGSGVLDLAGAKLCMFFTSWGDGVFPVYRDFAADGSLVRLRIQLETDESVDAMEYVNR